MTFARNAALVSVHLLVWAYLYVPNPYFSFLADGRQEPANNDVIFLWIPVILGIAFFVGHSGSSFSRLAMTVAAPIAILALIYVVGFVGMTSEEATGWGLMLVLFPLRPFLIAVVLTAISFVTVGRLRKQSRIKGTPAT